MKYFRQSIVRDVALLVKIRERTACDHLQTDTIVQLTAIENPGGIKPDSFKFFGELDQRTATNCDDHRIGYTGHYET